MSPIVQRRSRGQASSNSTPRLPAVGRPNPLPSRGGVGARARRRCARHEALNLPRDEPRDATDTAAAPGHLRPGGATYVPGARRTRARSRRHRPRVPGGGWQPRSIRWRTNAIRSRSGWNGSIPSRSIAGDPLEVEQQRQLAGRVVPLARVVALHPGGQRGERLDLELVLPPAASGPPAGSARAASRRRSTAARTTASARAETGRARSAASGPASSSGQSSSRGQVVAPVVGSVQAHGQLPSSMAWPGRAAAGRRTTSAAAPAPARAARRAAARGRRAAGAAPRGRPAAGGAAPVRAAAAARRRSCGSCRAPPPRRPGRRSSAASRGRRRRAAASGRGGC